MDGMDSPLQYRVKVDGQGRLVLPRALRPELVTVPGELLIRRTADGVLLTPADRTGTVSEAEDGLPVLTIGRRVTNDEVLAALDQERADR